MDRYVNTCDWCGSVFVSAASRGRTRALKIYDCGHVLENSRSTKCLLDGSFSKKQVQEMVRSMLHLANIIKPDDAADAMAIAITHGLSVNTRRLMEKYDKSINK